MRQGSEGNLQNLFPEEIRVFFRSFIVGGISASISKIVTAPVERVKIILQVQNDLHLGKQFNGTCDVVRTLWRSQPQTRSIFIRPVTFWRGNYANLVRYIPMQAIGFACKDRIKGSLLPRGKKFSFIQALIRNCLAGGLAGAVGVSVVYPLDVARTKISSDTNVRSRFKGILPCLKEIYTHGGIKALYKGFGMSVCGIIPYRAASFGLYDQAKRFLMNDKPEDKTFLFRWAISQTTSVLSQFAGYPFDTIRRRMQVSSGNGNVLYKNSIDCIKKMWKNEGILSFFVGSMANMIRATGCALCLICYDSIGRFLFLDKNYGR